MIRGLSLVALAAALATPALAEPAAPVDASKAAQTAELSAASEMLEVRQHFVRQGYVNVSNLAKDENGRWTGTATKDGKVIFIAMHLDHQKKAAVTQ